MFWADKIANQIIKTGKYQPYWVDDMKTPSGRIHVGSLRGVVVHDLIHRALRDAGKQVKFTYLFEDHDPMDGLPIYLEKAKWEKYLGQPLFTVPSPDPKAAKNYAEYFALEFKAVFNKIGSHPQIIWSGELYKSGKMNADIKTCLDKAEVIRQIYEEMYKKALRPDWYPFQVVCPKCAKESTTQVNNWDSELVHFTCNVEGLDWTKGCGFQGKVSPFSGDGIYRGKLLWKVEWAVKWKVVGITVEGAGKDHMGAGGSHDIAEQICKRVIDYPIPFGFMHEFFLIGGKKMSSSKGMGVSAKEVADIMPPHLVRFVFTRTDYNQAIEFNPVGTMAIPDLFDEYDRCWQAFIDGTENELARAFELAQIDKISDKEKIFLPRFRDVINYVQLPNVDLAEKFAETKGSPLKKAEQNILKERADYAEKWLKNYASSEFKFHMTDKLPAAAAKINPVQRTYLEKVSGLVNEYDDPEKLQTELYEVAKLLKISIKDAFAAIYISFLGKSHGPRAAWFLLQYPKEQVIDRLNDAITSSSSESQTSREVSLISRSEYFTIDEQVEKTFPSVTVGIALIKNATIAKSHPELETEKDKLLQEYSRLTTEQLGKYPEILSYRKLYKQMGVDWHSKRPSPEALLRRVALKKGLYTVNTCVDAYNLIVIKYRVSVGAFDADEVKFPTDLRFPKPVDEILLLGDDEPTKYTGKELAYYDKSGGYNIYFNYRDAQRTAVTEKTKNLWINVDGIFDITPQMVERSLNETVKMVIKYCGGIVEFQGVVK